MKKKHTDIPALLEQEAALRSRITADLAQLRKCQEGLLEAAKDFEQDYSRRVANGDRYPISFFIQRLRRAFDDTRRAYAVMVGLKSESYDALTETLAEQERRRKAQQERRARRVSDA
jgi:spore germination protein YaaH